MSRIKETLAELERYIGELELENTRQKEKVKQLLNESDVKSLPSYKLLLGKYGEQEEIEVDTAQESQQRLPIREVALPVVTDESIKDLVYQSIYEPPRLRHAPKKKSAPATAVAVAPPEEPKKKSAPKITPQPPTVIKVPEGEMLYSVELNKVKYYVYYGRMFDMNNLTPVGYVSHDAFVFETGETFPIKRDPSLKSMESEGFPDYRKDSADIVYQRIGGVFHGIGTYSTGDINLWVPEDEGEDNTASCLF